MNFLELKLSDISESETNPRGEIDDKKLEDLVSSIKEKGVLVPIIVRIVPEGHEIVAGHRRFRAAKLAGLETIPAEVKIMTDDEAREVQIIENLQREDVHPIDEGLSYRQLAEGSGYSVATIALRVGKSETYVRQRLFLTNLSPRAAVIYREGKVKSTRKWGIHGFVKVHDGHMVMLAKLSHADQDKVISECIAEEGESISISKLKEYIDENIYDILSNQPWLTDKLALEAVGPCKECKPDTLTLFGEIKDGSCTDTKCWKRKMDKYVEYKIQKNDIHLKVSKLYGSADSKDVISRSDYEMVGKKNKCEFSEKAIVSQGPDMGTLVEICRNSKCKVHHPYRSSGYELTPEEKKKRKEENKKEKEKEMERNRIHNENIFKALEKIALPLSPEIIRIMADTIMHNIHEEFLKDIVERHEWEPLVKEEKIWPGDKIRKVKDWRKTVKKRIKTMDPDNLMKLIFEMNFLIAYSPSEILSELSED